MKWWEILCNFLIWKHVFPFGIFLIHEISKSRVSDLEWMGLSFGCLDCDYIGCILECARLVDFQGAETGLVCGLCVSMQCFIPGIILFFLWTFYEVVAIKTMSFPPQVTHVPNSSSSIEQTDFTRNPQMPVLWVAAGDHVRPPPNPNIALGPTVRNSSWFCLVTPAPGLLRASVLGAAGDTAMMRKLQSSQMPAGAWTQYHIQGECDGLFQQEAAMRDSKTKEAENLV